MTHTIEYMRQKMYEYKVTVHDLAKASSYAYLTKNEADPKFYKMGYPNVKYYDNSGAQAYVVWNEDNVIVVFRGTQPDQFNDIKADLNVWPKKSLLAGRVHLGFEKEVSKLWELVKHQVLDVRFNQTLQKNRKLFVTGHSLGGAMATIVAGRLPSVTCLCTFGSPKVGNREYCKSNITNHIRFVNNNDIVPSVPPAIFTYKHHGELCYINFYGNVRKLTPWQRFKDQMRGRWAALKKRQFFDGAYDHGMKYYMRYTEGLKESIGDKK
jgi:triacylglycerol lipase